MFYQKIVCCIYWTCRYQIEALSFTDDVNVVILYILGWDVGKYLTENDNWIYDICLLWKFERQVNTKLNCYPVKSTGWSSFLITFLLFWWIHLKTRSATQIWGIDILILKIILMHLPLGCRFVLNNIIETGKETTLLRYKLI